MIERDLKHIWHPCSQMKDYETFKPIEIASAKGGYFYLNDGRRVFDAISSWWCKSLGHAHPRLKSALQTQAETLEHVILANTTNATIVALSEQLASLSPSLNKVMYASDGSCAVEMALKMSLHARRITGEKKSVFIALENSYHGETAGAMSVSDLGLYRAPYEPMLFDTKRLAMLPYVSGQEDPLWQDCEQAWQHIERQLLPYQQTATAMIVEPMLQGAGGMKIYSADLLRRLRQWTQEHGVHLIADEIMTGLGRTGKMLACEYAGIEPDFVCLSKGLTAGWLPMSAMLTRQSIYDLFYDDYVKGQSFLHSHTFSGNVLAASVAIEVLHIIKEDNICDQANELGRLMHRVMMDVACHTKKLTRVRQLGAMVAADLISDEPGRRLGYEVYQHAVAMGALLRPLGNTIYWMPPLNSHKKDIEFLGMITERAISSV